MFGNDQRNLIHHENPNNEQYHHNDVLGENLLKKYNISVGIMHLQVSEMSITAQNLTLCTPR
jgi:hypothetical protein